MQIHSYSKHGINIEFTTAKAKDLDFSRRIDSEYFTPQVVKNEENICSKNGITLKDSIFDIRYGLHIEPNYQEKGIDFIRAMNLGKGNIDGEILKVKRSEIPNSYLLQEEEVLIVRSGANVGDTGIVLNKNTGFSFGSYIIKFRFNRKLVNPYYVEIFLKSNNGRISLDRIKSGMAQPNLNIPNLKTIFIPIPSPESKLQEKIEEAVKLAYEKKEKSKTLYNKAETILLEEIGLLDYKPETVEIELYNGHKVRVNTFMNIKTVQEVRETDRIDGQYYLPEYEDFEKKVVQYKNGYTVFSHLVRHIKKGKLLENSEEKTENSTPYVLISNLRGSEYTSFTEEKNGVYCTEKDILIVGDGSKSGEVGTDIEGFVGSTLYTMKLRQEKLNKYSILNILKMYFKKLNDLKTGSGVPHLDKRVLMDLKIPLLDEDTQTKISECVAESKKLKKESEELLEKAKRAVEVFIEEDEEAGVRILSV